MKTREQLIEDPLELDVWLPLEVVLKAEPFAAKKNVSKTARGVGGFVRVFENIGDVLEMNEAPFSETQTWGQKRAGFIKRHMAQMEDEPWWDGEKEPTRRHLALVMWAYTPDPEGVRAWLEEKG